MKKPNPKAELHYRVNGRVCIDMADALDLLEKEITNRLAENFANVEYQSGWPPGSFVIESEVRFSVTKVKGPITCQATSGDSNQYPVDLCDKIASEVLIGWLGVDDGEAYDHETIEDKVYYVCNTCYINALKKRKLVEEESITSRNK